jgi:hypothetical protein
VAGIGDISVTLAIFILGPLGLWLRVIEKTGREKILLFKHFYPVI